AQDRPAKTSSTAKFGSCHTTRGRTRAKRIRRATHGTTSSSSPETRSPIVMVSPVIRWPHRRRKESASGREGVAVCLKRLEVTPCANVLNPSVHSETCLALDSAFSHPSPGALLHSKTLLSRWPQGPGPSSPPTTSCPP